MLREDDSLYPVEDTIRIHRRKKGKSKTELDIKREIRRVDQRIHAAECMLKGRLNEERKKQLATEIADLYEERDLWQGWLQSESNVQRPQRRFRVRYRKRKFEKAYQMIKDRVEEIKKDPSYRRNVITKEDTARRLNIPEAQIEQVFHRMNLEGILSQAIHRYPHDNNRNPWDGGGFSGWQSDIYEILDQKET